MAPGADGREPLDGGCGGCAKATVANSATTTTKHRVDGFNTILSRPMAVAYPSLSTATSGSRSGERTGHRRRLLAGRAVGLLGHRGIINFGDPSGEAKIRIDPQQDSVLKQ
jgi:hypothetical protein